MDSRQNCTVDTPRLCKSLGAGPFLLRQRVRPLPDEIFGEAPIIVWLVPLSWGQLVVVLCAPRQILVNFGIFSDRMFVFATQRQRRWQDGVHCVRIVLTGGSGFFVRICLFRLFDGSLRKLRLDRFTDPNPEHQLTTHTFSSASESLVTEF